MGIVAEARNRSRGIECAGWSQAVCVWFAGEFDQVVTILNYSSSRVYDMFERMLQLDYHDGNRSPSRLHMVHSLGRHGDFRL